MLEASRGAWSPSRLPPLKHAVSEMSGTLIQNKGFFPLFLKRAGISTLLPSSLRDTLLAPFVERVEDETREVLEAWMNQGSSSRFGAFKKGD